MKSTTDLTDRMDVGWQLTQNQLQRPQINWLQRLELECPPNFRGPPGDCSYQIGLQRISMWSPKKELFSI